jgi:two-component system, OmpR family, sensor histidine kinase NblS
MQIFQCLQKRLYDINCQTRLIAFITMIISLIISSIIVGAFSNMQQDFIETNTHLGEDLILLLISKLLFLVQQSNELEVHKVFEEIYLELSSINYLTFLDSRGLVFYDFPEDLSRTQYLIQNNLILLNYQDINYLFYTSLIHYSLLFSNQILDITIPLLRDSHELGCMKLGMMINFNILSRSQLIEYISIIIFISIWSTVIFFVLFNSVNIICPIHRLKVAIKSIAHGNFSQRVSLSTQRDLANLIVSFNQMAERLEFYKKKNIEELILEKSKLETLISIIADGAILLDQELRIIFINRVALKTLAICKHGIVGTHIYDYFPSYINEQFLPVLNNIVRKNFHGSLDTDTQYVLLKFNNQHSKVLRFVLTTAFNKDKSMLTGVAIVIEDLTKEMKLNEAKAQFISNVSHELRTPLFNIKSFLETLYEYNDSLSDIEKMDFLSIANQETQRLTLLVNDVLDLSRLESDFQCTYDAIILSELILSIMQISQLRAKNKQIILFHRICSRIFKIEAHYNLFIQVLSNLLDNSLKFIQRGGRIIIKAYLITSSPTSKTNILHKVRIQVIDEGIGINICDQSRIFDRFVRVENNIHILEGTGLGLSIVKNIIEKHKSTIFVYSELNVGSCFWFDLFLLEKKD